MSAPDLSDAAMLAAFDARARCEFRVSWPNPCPMAPPNVRDNEWCCTHRMIRWADRMIAILQSGEGDPFAVQPDAPYPHATCVKGSS